MSATLRTDAELLYEQVPCGPDTDCIFHGDRWTLCDNHAAAKRIKELEAEVQSQRDRADALEELARLQREARERVEEVARRVVNWMASIPEDEESPGAEWVYFEDAIADLRAALEEEE